MSTSDNVNELMNREHRLRAENERLRNTLMLIREMAQEAIDTGGRSELNPAEVVDLCQVSLAETRRERTR